MKTRLFIAAALFASLVGIGYCVQANAADIPSKAAPAPVVVVAPVDPWSGAYAGAIAGGAFSTGVGNLEAYSNGVYQSGVAGLPPVPVYTAYALGVPATVKPNTDGFVTGGTLGYNFHTGSFVYGVEADAVSNVTPSGTSTFVTPGLGVAPSVAQIGRAWNYAGTADVRLGYLVSPGVLVYGKGGLAWAHENTGVQSFGSAMAATYGNTASSSLVAGWNLGAGVEALIGSGWSVKAEYKFVSLAKQTASFGGFSYGDVPGTGALSTYLVSYRPQEHVVTVGLNYHFNAFAAPTLASLPWAPVSAAQLQTFASGLPVPVTLSTLPVPIK
jgi:outer membrane immunogenic protein